MKEREFEILKMFLDKKTLTLKQLVEHFSVSERTIRYSIEAINMFLNEKSVEKIINNKKGYFFNYISVPVNMKCKKMIKENVNF